MKKVITLLLLFMGLSISSSYAYCYYERFAEATYDDTYDEDSRNSWVIHPTNLTLTYSVSLYCESGAGGGFAEAKIVKELQGQPTGDIVFYRKITGGSYTSGGSTYCGADGFYFMVWAKTQYSPFHNVSRARIDYYFNC